MTIDQLSFTNSSSSASSGPTVSVIENSQPVTKNVGVGIYLSLMGTFNFLAPIFSIYSTSNGSLSSLSPLLFHTSYLSDPRTLPSLVEYGKGIPFFRMDMFLCETNGIFQDSYETM